MATRGKSKTSFQHAEQSPGFLLWQVAHLWQRKIMASLKTLELTHVQFVLLAGLKHLEEERRENVTQVNLANYAKTDIMMTSKVVRKLEEKGFVERRNHPTDTRAKSLSLTPNGEKLLLKAVQIVDEVDLEFFLQENLHNGAVADLMRNLQTANAQLANRQS